MEGAALTMVIHHEDGATLRQGETLEGSHHYGGRGHVLLIEADKAEDLWSWFAPLFDVAKPVIQPLVPFEILPKLFEEMQKLRY